MFQEGMLEPCDREHTSLGLGMGQLYSNLCNHRIMVGEGLTWCPVSDRGI